MQDVIAAVESAKLEYEMRSRKGKIREYLVAFSSRVMYYGSIMDSLSQHHPEYVALAWGTMKFLFVVGLLMEAPHHDISHYYYSLSWYLLSYNPV